MEDSQHHYLFGMVHSVRFRTDHNSKRAEADKFTLTTPRKVNTVNSQNRKESKHAPLLIALATAGLLGIGLNGCDKNPEMSDNNMRIEEPMNNAQDATSDAWITTKVKSELLADSLSKGFEINVNTVEGVVSLDGKVKDIASVNHVQQIAEGVKGVTQVDTTGLMLEETKAY